MTSVLKNLCSVLVILFLPAGNSFFVSDWSNQSSILLLTVVSRKYIGRGITITSVLWLFLNALPRICSSETLWAQWDILEFKSSLQRHLLIFLPCICPITFWTCTILELIPISYHVTVMPGPGVSLGLRYIWCCAKKERCFRFWKCFSLNCKAADSRWMQNCGGTLGGQSCRMSKRDLSGVSCESASVCFGMCWG